MEPGTLIQDRYELTAPIGAGGMAEVWRARDTRLDRDVAIKFLAPRLAQDPEFLVRFFAEAQSIARISHPGVVSVLDFGQDSDRPYLVMEHLTGGALADLDEALTVERALEVVEQAARGAGAAHDAGLVHRDIKPGNILLDDDSNAKIADFGISAGTGAERLTATGAAIGSPHYISPEQVSGRDATPASDVYSLGVVLYELICGRRPFEADNVTAIAIAQVDKEPEPPSSHVEDLDPNIDALVMTCLAKDPLARFANGNVLADAIAGTLAGRNEATAAFAAVMSDQEEVEDVDVSRKPRTLVAALVVLALLGLTSAALFAGASNETPATATTEEESAPAKRKKPSPSPSETSSATTAVANPSASASPETTEDDKADSSNDKQKEEKPKEPVEEPEPVEPSPTPEPDEPSPASSPADTGTGDQPSTQSDEGNPAGS